MKGIYSKRYLIPIIVLLMAVLLIKVHSLRRFPDVSDWNFYQIKDIQGHRGAFWR